MKCAKISGETDVEGYIQIFCRDKGDKTNQPNTGLVSFITLVDIIGVDNSRIGVEHIANGLNVFGI